MIYAILLRKFCRHNLCTFYADFFGRKNGILQTLSFWGQILFAFYFVLYRINHIDVPFKVLSGEATEKDAWDYKKWIFSNLHILHVTKNRYFADNLCIGTCPEHSGCENGMCVCNQGHPSPIKTL